MEATALPRVLMVLAPAGPNSGPLWAARAAPCAGVKPPAAGHGADGRVHVWNARLDALSRRVGNHMRLEVRRSAVSCRHRRLGHRAHRRPARKRLAHGGALGGLMRHKGRLDVVGNLPLARRNRVRGARHVAKRHQGTLLSRRGAGKERLRQRKLRRVIGDAGEVSARKGLLLAGAGRVADIQDSRL